MVQRVLSQMVTTSIILLTLVPSWGLEKVKFGTGSKGIPDYELPLMAAAEGGFWKGNNLEAEWLPLTGGTMPMALAAGSIDAGMTDAASAIQAVARGVPILIIADLQFEDHFSIWVIRDSRIREPRDLKGAKIGTARFGGTSHAYGRLIAKALDMEKEMKFVSLGGLDARLAAVKAGAIEAFVMTYIPIANLAVTGELREVTSARNFLPKKWVGRVIVSRRDFLEKKPEVARRMLKTLFQSTEFLMKSSDWTLEKLKSRWGFQEEAARIALGKMHYGRQGKVDQEALGNVVNFMVEFNIIPKETAPPLERLYTNRFVN